MNLKLRPLWGCNIHFACDISFTELIIFQNHTSSKCGIILSFNFSKSYPHQYPSVLCAINTMHYIITHWEVNSSCLQCSWTHITVVINYGALDVASAANYHLSRAGWPQSAGSYASLFYASPEISHSSAPSKLDEEPENILQPKYTVTTNLGSQ